MRKLIVGLLLAVLTVGCLCFSLSCVNTGEECKHEWGEWSVSKVATCLEEGEEKRVCKKDSSHVERRSTALGKHKGVGTCSVCGAEIPSAGYYENLLTSMITNDYGIVLEDFELKTGSSSSTIDFAELYLYVDEEGKLNGYGHGKYVDSYLDKDNYVEVAGAIKDGKLYARVPTTVFYDNSIKIGEDTYNAFATTNEEIGYMVADLSSEEDVGKIVKLLTAVKTNVLPYVASIISYNGSSVAPTVATVMQYLFTEEVVEDNKVLTLNFNSLKEINTVLSTKTVAQIYDMLFGEGEYDKLYNKLAILCDITFKSGINLLSDYGIEYTDLVNLIKSYIALSGNPDFVDEQFEQIMTGEWQTLTIGEFIASMILGVEWDLENSHVGELKTMIMETLTAYRDVVIYDLIAGEEQGAEGIASVLAKYIDQVSQVGSIKLTTSGEGDLLRVEIEDSEMVLAGENPIPLKGKVSFVKDYETVNAEKYESLITDVDGVISQIEITSETKINKDEDLDVTLTVDGTKVRIDVSRSAVVYDRSQEFLDQGFYLKITYSRYGYREFDYENDIMAVSNCGDWVMPKDFEIGQSKGSAGRYQVIKMDAETDEEIGSYEGYYNAYDKLETFSLGIGVYYNLKTKEIAITNNDEMHDWEMVEEKSQLTIKNHVGHVHYKCANCGEEYDQYFTDNAMVGCRGAVEPTTISLLALALGTVFIKRKTK